MQNYDFLVKRIAAYAGISSEEVERKVEAKRAKLSGLISREGAAQIIATELGINFDNLDIKIVELMPGMKKVNLVVKIVKIFPIRNFKKSDREGKVLNLIVADDTGSTKLVLWDTNHIALFENGSLKEGDVVEIKNASVRESEIHLSGFSDIKKSSFIFEEIKVNNEFVEKKLSEIKERDFVLIRGTIVQIFQPRIYNVCSVCGKKITITEEGYFCASHGIISPKEKSMFSLILDDGSDNIRVSIFSDLVNKISSEDELKSEDSFLRFKQRILGSELSVKGFIRKNPIFNSFEIISQDLDFVYPDDLIARFS